MSSSSSAGNAYVILTDPDQAAQGLYKVTKTANITTTLAALNGARAAKDFRVVKSVPCADLKKLEEFLKSVLKTKLVSGSTEWVRVDEAGLAKLLTTIETLAGIVNEAG